MLELRSLNVYRRGSVAPTLCSISAQFLPGKIVGICGANGSGKSTLFHALAGEESLWYEAQKVKLNNIPLAELASSDICHFPQVQPFIAHDRVKRFLNFSKWSRVLAAQFEITELLDLPIGSLSQGQWKRVQCVAQFSRACKIRLLDEPEAALDRYGKSELARCLLECKRNSEIVLFASHDHQFLSKVCDFVLVLEKGKVVWHSDIENFSRSAWVLL